MEKALEEQGMSQLFYEVEMPLVFVLYDMEKEGVLVKRNELKAYGEALSGRIAVLEESIYESAGEVFNINSPKQMGEVLYVEMGLPCPKKTKSGYSTDAETLEQLDVVKRERGAQRRHGVGVARLMQGDDVGVALDDDGDAGVRHGLLGLIEPVQHARLVEQWSLLRIEVFRFPLTYDASSECDAFALRVVDGEHHAIEEAVA